MQSTYAQQVSTDKNISVKNIGVGSGCLLSPTHSNSEDKVRVFYTIKHYFKTAAHCQAEWTSYAGVHV